MTKHSSKNKIVFEIVDNVFEALGIDNPEQEMARCELVGRIFRIGRERKLTDKALAEMVGCKPERIALLHAVEYDDFTMDELNGYLVALGEEV